MASRASAFRLVAPLQTEHELQIDCTVMLTRILLPDVAWTAVDHAHSLNLQPGRSGRPIGFGEVAKRRARGVRAGIPDYLFWRRCRGYAIELKRSADEALSEDQEVFGLSLISAGVELAICWTPLQVFNRVVTWGLARKAVVMA